MSGSSLSKEKVDESKQRSANIVDLVEKIEGEMGLFKYSKLKLDQKMVNRPENLSR